MTFSKKSKDMENQNHWQPRLGARERRLLSETSHIEEELIPGFVRPILMIVSALIFFFLIWAAVAQMKEVARAPGEILPNGSIKVVQHLDGGIVSKIAVDERTLVEADQIVMTLDGAQVKAELTQMQARFESLRLRSERLKSFAENRKPEFGKATPTSTQLAGQQQILQSQVAARASAIAILDSQVDQRQHRLTQLSQSLKAAKEQLALATELSAMRDDLGARKLVTKTVVLETRRAKIAAQGEVARLTEEMGIGQNELAEIKARRLDTVNQLRRDAMTEYGAVTAELSEVAEQVKRFQDKVYRLDIRAPIRGLIHDLRAKTLGQVIQPGALIMQIVSDKVVVEAEVQISARDIGFVKVGQPVNLRVTSFDYARYGIGKGFLKRISASSVVGADGKPYYKGLIELTNQYVGNEPANHPMQPGMTIEAEILTGQKTLLQYLTKPLIDVMSTSFSER
jgi:HlyD family type I secretion membrane fusion protein